MQPDNYKPKTTIIPANRELYTSGGQLVVAWVIEDGQVAKAITWDQDKPIRCSAQRGVDE